nr:AAA family ATPase [Sandaracinobacteroides sayramensis]
MTGGQLPVIAAVDGLTVADTRTLLRAGALDVLPLPFTAEELRQAVEPARRPARPAASRGAPQQPRRQGKVVAFLGTTGGAGVTSVATQLGILWAANAKVCCIDFDVQFGNAALLMDLRPSLHLGHLIEDAERLDPDLLQSVAMAHPSGMALVACPSEMMPLDIVSIEFVDRLLRLATQVYDVVLVDLPSAWTEWTVRVLQRADTIAMVTGLGVPGLHQARRQLEVIEANGLMPKLKIVANRVQKGLFGKVDLKETEAVLGRKVEFTLADDPAAVSAANDEGRSLKEVKPSSRVLKDLKALAESLQTAAAVDGGGQ